jgi:flagellar hook-associated protein 3 FlgL
MMVSQSVRRLSQRMESYERIQQQVATGKKFLKPSQAPADANTGIALRASQRSREQEQRAGADAESWLNIVDGQMQSAVDRLHRLRDLTVGANPQMSDAQAKGVEQEMQAIQEELLAIANAEHRGRPLFGGYSDADPVTAGTWAFNDDGGRVMRRVGEQDEIRVNVLATEAFRFTDSTGAPTSTFDLIDDLKADILTGGAAVSAHLEDLDLALDQIAAQQGRIGATANHLESAQRRNFEIDLAIRTELAETEDVDVAEAVMELQVQQLGFEATLKAVGTALPPSLISFI